ncbi:MAG: AbrB/MazE/SpoVT family DNA-binding domain-containing protein [Chloroflexota bacterium]
MSTPMTWTVRPLRRGQVLIPAEFRRQLGIGEESWLQLSLHGNRIEITPLDATPLPQMAWARELYDLFASIRQQAQAMDSAEIDALIDEAILEVRSQKA